nr:MAG TPA: helix-turn-helix domain protein [Caudoviricetes sp.]
MKENIKPKSEINLRKLMQKLGLGTNAFAEKCGMSSQSMSQFLRNKSLTTNTIYRIAMTLDIDPRDMFFPTNEKDDLFSNADKKENEDVAENEPASPVHENGLVSENQQEEGTAPANGMIQTSTFCPHCGKKVRVGVVLLPEE